MSTLNGNYKAVVEGRLAKGEFLRQARQMVPQYISQFNSFDDAVKILTRKGLLSEELIYRNKADKFPLESIERGIRYELEIMDVMDIHYPSQEQYKKARQRAIDNLCKDPLYYINKVAAEIKQPTQEETEGDLKKAEAGNKHTLKESRYTENVEEDKAQAMHKDINMNADVGSGTEAPEKKPQAARTQYKDPHNWTVNEYKIAYIIAEFGKEGLKAVFKFFGTPISNASLKLLANNVIGTTDAGLQFAVDGMRKVATSEKGADDWLQSYFNNTKSVEAYKALNGQDLKNSIASLAKETCSEEEAAAARNAQEQIDTKKKEGQQAIDAATKKIVTNAKDYYTNNRAGFRKAFPNDPVKADRAAIIGTFKKYGYDVDDPRRAILWAHLRNGMIDVTSQALRDMDSKLNVNDKNAAAFRAKSLAKKANLQEKAEKFYDKQILKESITHIIGKILNEAATANLAQLSDENASVAELPGIINSLENIVTEIESFWIKEQQKIQGVFDQVGNIKNDDGLPVGYKFVQPMLESLKKDLEPVLAKITLDDLKLPEAPAPDQTQVNDPNADVDPNDPNAVPPVPEKKTVFSPAEKEQPLQESKKNKRYTK